MVPYNIETYLSNGYEWYYMREITTELKIDKQGRIVIPEIYRQELEIEPGQLVKITISNPKKND